MTGQVGSGVTYLTGGLAQVGLRSQVRNHLRDVIGYEADEYRQNGVI